MNELQERDLPLAEGTRSTDSEVMDPATVNSQAEVPSAESTDDLLWEQIDALTSEKENAKWLAFCEEYPEISQLPPEVAAAVAGGESPLSAYRAYENKQLKEELAILKQNNSNRIAAIGSASSEGEGAVEPDPFLSGLLGK